MVRLLSIVILISMITLVFAENPGFVAVIKKPIIDKAKEKYFKSILEVIGRQTIPDFHDGDLRITNIQVWIENDKPEHMNIGFTPVLKEASLSLRDSQLKVQANWKYSKLLVDVTGSVDMKGEFTSFGLDFLMDKTGDKGLYIPQLRINNFNMELDENKFNIKIH